MNYNPRYHPNSEQISRTLSAFGVWHVTLLIPSAFAGYSNAEIRLNHVLRYSQQPYLFSEKRNEKPTYTFSSYGCIIAPIFNIVNKNYPLRFALHFSIREATYSGSKVFTPREFETASLASTLDPFCHSLPSGVSRASCNFLTKNFISFC